MTDARPLLELTDLTKRFGDLVANDAVSLTVGRGEVVAMLGENGAGKSTLMRTVYGLLSPDRGTVRVDGRQLHIGSPRDAMAAGIGMVTQEFSLVGTMTVTENVALSSVGFGRVDVGSARSRVLAAMDRIGVRIDPDRLVSTLSIGERQRVEIVKALFHECRVLILDEPTAVLTPQDVRALFVTVRRLRSSGLGVLFVSHKLREVLDISDRVVVLRRGRLVGERVTREVSAAELAALMMGAAGRTPDEESAPALGLPVESPPAGGAGPQGAGRAAGAHGGPDPGTTTLAPPALAVSDLTLLEDGRLALDAVTLRVRPGTVTGVAGISGNGQTELMELLCGLRRPSRGRIEVAGNDVTSLGVAERLAAGLGRLTEDRRGSLVGTLSVEHNLVLEDLPRFTRRGMLDRRAIRAHAEAMIARFDIRAEPGDPVWSLSGGNMQKVLLARALARRPHVLVAAQPTRGLDIGAYRYVHAELEQLRASGAGVVLISEDLDELRALSDEVVVLFRGRVVGSLPVAEATGDRLGRMMTGEGAPLERSAGGPR